MSHLNIRQLEAFRAVMLSGSVTGASELLRVTQPSVSKLIAQLEANTSLRLFDRLRGRLVPRPEAKGLFLQVDKAFAVLEETARSARRIAHGASGHLRLVSIPACGLEFLPNAISMFLKERENAMIEFNIRSSSYVEEWVSNKQVDAGFATATAAGAGVDVEPFVSLKAVCVLPNAHPLTHKSHIEPEDLATERLCCTNRDADARRLTA
ncbi:hypothetical protein AVHY2522_24285 [Acidovorax sp. SUPP2522]|uniref:LysR substrate-binding domain-containing protein n=1 Tax=unclassified Acidovorax TaxID=2684926 RepID=UPI00234B19CA|nr:MULTISPECIES: LysR substrate-binding domain-containing protein [unclassified Acidovorax]WCM96142.1 LysR substrate-binding domain-containing protein [Acidovorax sp. GBBC 1281]GKT19934.1 hypothetical protein AVHY2522_24285 [Acidovorax sp. SUPP2522]